MNRVSLLLLGISLVPANIALAQLTPDESLKKFTVADGLQIELFAAEPMLINPTSIDVDHKGRVWVCEAVNYRRVKSGKPLLRLEGDRIVILEDTDGDGKADKSHVFYQAQDFVAPLGIAVAPYPDGKGQKVFVCHSSDILVFEDKDGDLKADGPPTKLLSGFGGFDTDHGLHGINIGPDGKLYFTVGDAGVKNVQSSDGQGPKWTSNQTDCRAGTIWRCDMDGKNLELIAHNFRNHYECCVNSFGEIWTSDNDDDGTQQTRLCYVMPGGNYGYHPRGPGQSHWHEEQPGIVHKVLRTGFGSPSGICFYEGTLLPKKYHGQILHCDAGPREFRCFHITPKGAGYEAEKEVLVTSSDNWFRLSDCCVAPDGSVMLADWYDPGVGGGGMGDWTRGRIYRVTPKGHKGYKVPKVDVDAQDGLITAFVSPNLAARYLATGTLKSCVNQIAAAMVDPNNSKPSEAFKVLHGKINRLVEKLRVSKTSKKLDSARWFWATCIDNTRLDNPTPLFRPHDLFSESDQQNRSLVTALRIDRVNGNEFFFDPQNLLQKEVNQVKSTIALARTKNIDEALTVFGPTAEARRELLITMRTLEPSEVLRLFYPLAKFYDGQDHFYRAALNIACGTDPARRDAILAEFDMHFPDWNDKVADLVWELRPKSVLPRLAKLLTDVKLTAAQKARIVDILAASDDASAGQALLALLGNESPAAVRDRALENLQIYLPTKWKDLANSNELNQAIDKLLGNTATRIAGLRLIAAAGSLDAVGKVCAIVQSEKDAETTSEAIRTLGKLPSPQAVETLALVAAAKSVFALEAIIALGMHLASTPKKANVTADGALKVLQDVLLREQSSPAVKQAALSALAGGYNGTKWLLDAHEMKLLPKELLADAGKLLRNSPYQAERNRALDLFPTPGKLDAKKLPPIAELAKRIGDVERGSTVFAASFKGETQCLRCHTVRGRGGNIGPDLSMIGKKASKENLFESILLPSKAIADQYLQWKIETTAGQSILGLCVEETPTHITIRDANGKDTRVPTAEIDNRAKSAVSIMPDNLAATLSEDDLIDLVAYLFTLKTASLTPAAWSIIGPFENTAGKGFDAVFEPEKMATIDLTTACKGKKGEVKWKTIRNLDGYVDLTAHDGAEGGNSASYLYQRIESPVDQEATVLIGHTGSAKLWLNGVQVYANRDRVAAVPERKQLAVKLKKGVNTLLLKVVNEEGPYGFYLSVTSEQELKIATLGK